MAAINIQEKKIRNLFYGMIKKVLFRSKKIKYRNKLNEYIKAYDFMPEELKDYFDSELTMLIVDNKYRGKGIGKAMFDYICEAAKKDGIKNMAISTDESSNWEFYEKNDSIKKYEREVFNGEKAKEKAYIYEKKL